MQNNINKSKAILYIRVSGNEKTKGSYIRSQEAMLTDYCTKNNIEIVEVVKDDCSALDFKRPAWKQMMSRIRRGTLEADQLLFITWDRFSRNTEAAYSMIETLQKLKVYPQAIDQRIDFSVPEQIILLSIYFSGPTVDSLRRRLKLQKKTRSASKSLKKAGALQFN